MDLSAQFVGNQTSFGTLYFEKGEFLNAVPYLIQEQELHLKQNRIREYFAASYRLLRAYIEMEQMEKVDELKRQLQRFVSYEDVEMSSKLYYTLGICNFIEGDQEGSLKFFNQAFNKALSESHKEDMCYALLGKIGVYKALEDYENAFSLLENLKFFLEGVEVPEVKASAALIEAQILYKRHQFDEALDCLWRSYSESKNNKSVVFMNYYNLIQFGLIYTKIGNYEMAKAHFDLVEAQLNPEENIRTYKLLKSYQEELENAKKVKADLVIDLDSNKIVESEMGEVDFKNQFILLSLLVELVKRGGGVLTKSDLADILWNEDYSPDVHDNKIYVTIRRLRKLVEPDKSNPKYVLRNKEGYLINKKARVSIRA